MAVDVSLARKRAPSAAARVARPFESWAGMMAWLGSSCLERLTRLISPAAASPVGSVRIVGPEARMASVSLFNISIFFAKENIEYVVIGLTKYTCTRTNGSATESGKSGSVLRCGEYHENG